MEYVVQGKKGNGKGIIAVAMIEDYLRRGRPVATNLNIFLEHLLPTSSRTTMYRIPDQPTYQDMVNLGSIPTGGDERQNGLLVLDECASWLNSRDYTDPERKKLLDWFVHSRKHGWDVIYIIQSINMLDKQFRDGFAEHLVTVVRLDRLGVPFVGALVKLFGFALRFPQIHIGIVRYGTSANAPVVDRIVRRGKRLWKAYDTLQKFSKLNEHAGVSSTLSAWHVKGRHQTWWQMYKTVMGSSFGLGILCCFLLVVSIGKQWDMPDRRMLKSSRCKRRCRMFPLLGTTSRTASSLPPCPMVALSKQQPIARLLLATK
jgi:hypothetical protein